MPSLPAIAPFLGDTSRLKAYRKYSDASAVGFLSAILFAVFSEPVKTYVDFGEKWMALSGLPYQMNTAMLGFIVGFGFVRIWLLMRLQIMKSLLSYRGWMHNPKSTTTKLWALMLNALRGTGDFPTFFFEPLLPKLPVPDLNSTCERCLASFRPILSDEDYMNLLTAMITFKEKDGPRLQQYLLQKAAVEDNWLSEYWLNIAYLAHRGPSAIKVNCYATDRKELPSHNQIARAANLIHWTISFYEHLKEDTLIPQYLQEMIPLSMEGYRRQFCTTRLPGEHIDSLRTYEESKHVVIYRNGVYYKLDMYAPDSDGKDRLLTVTELYDIIKNIMEQTNDTKECCEVAVFTAQKRDVWANIRQRLLVSENCESLEAVESAITFISLDSATPKTIDENGTYTMVGDGINRWHDKSVQFTISANGKLGINLEHASTDGSLPGRLWEYVLHNEKYNEDGDIVRQHYKRPLPKPQRLTWNLKEFQKDIESSVKFYRSLANDFELVVTSPDYGKGFMKKQRLSPDGYIQMALQLAYYKLHNKIAKTYESASTRIFRKGRTETIRSVSEFSAQWVKSMQNERATREQRAMLLRKAVQYQTQYKMDASCGLGWDRHLVGLYCMCMEKGLPIPALFKDKSFLMPDALSTSQTPTSYTRQWSMQTSCMGGGFSPVSDQGYGVSYMIYGEDLIKFHVTSVKSVTSTSSAKMADAICDAMQDMKNLLS
ncbi:hypothetical protein FSP39_016746 [Pinctada imbricata]|uniref:Choline/carnitine acyltransferase domain-containing protein n=1 Tax=Pinctada imbricata TaxID=66713 RepID=A0AA88Y566_PINIB|nr:hypothetical protein FSP39_016746 [Pinctada imbricata]